MVTLTNIFCGYCVQNIKSSQVKNCGNWNFVDFRDLILILPEAATGGGLKEGVQKNFTIFTGKYICQSLFF